MFWVGGTQSLRFRVTDRVYGEILPFNTKRSHKSFLCRGRNIKPHQYIPWLLLPSQGLQQPWHPQRMHDDVIKWNDFPGYWPFVRGIHRWPVNSPHKGRWRRALMVSVIYAWINGWVNNREAGDLRRYRTHYYVTVMINGPVFHQEGCQPLVSFQCWEMVINANIFLFFLPQNNWVVKA